MSHPDRHNRQDGQIQNLRNFQILLRSVAYTALSGGCLFAAIYVQQQGLSAFWQKIAQFLTCCMVPVASALVIGLVVIIGSRSPRKKTDDVIPPSIAELPQAAGDKPDDKTEG